MYILTSNFMYISEVCTSIKFVKSESSQFYIDSNTRCLVVEFTEGMKFSDLTIPKFTSYSDDEIVEQEFVLNRADITINGINYKFTNEVKFMSCYILDGNHNVDDVNSNYSPQLAEGNMIYFQSGNLSILMNSLKMDLTAEQYVQWLNTSNYVKATVVDASKFLVSNFEAVDIKYSLNAEYNNTQYEYYKYKFNIDETDIVADFVRFIQREFPEYDVFHEISDLSEQKQKTKMLVYNAKLAEGQSEFGTRIIKHPIYGRMIQAKIQINWEFLTDDLTELIAFKNKLMVDKELFLTTEFKLDRPDADWYYTINWAPDLATDIERSPQTKVLSDTLLYNMPFSCELIGWVVETHNDLVPISYPIVRFYNNHWMLIGSLFNNSDPQVRWSTIIECGKTYYIIQEGTDRKVYLTNLQTKELLADYSLVEEDGELKLVDSEGHESDLYVPINIESAVSPLDLPHGVSVLDHLVRQVIKFDDINFIIKSKDKISYVIDILNYLKVLKWRKEHGKY